MKRFLPLIAASLLAMAPATAQKELRTQDDVQRNHFSIAQKDYDSNPQQKFDWSSALDNAKVDKPATYRGGNTEMLRDIARNLVYPAVALEQELQGIVMVQFAINEKGKVTAVKVLKSLSLECDQAAVNTVRKLGRFKPARHQGKVVPVTFTLPIRFRMN